MRRRTVYAGVEKRHAAPQFGGGSDGGLTAEQGKPRHSGATVRDFSPDYMEQMLAFVVQRIERRFPKPQIRVRFPARVREATEDFVASFVFGRECRQTVAENLHHADRVRTSLPMPAINGRTERHGLRTRFHRLWPQKCPPERASGIGLECAGTAYRHGNTRHRPNKRPFLAGFERVIEADPVLAHSRKGPIRQLHGTTRGGRAGPVSEFTRRDLARGRFRLSSGLAGMNAAGLLSCPAQSLGGGVSVCNGPEDRAPPGRRGGKAHRNRTANRTVGREIQSPDRLATIPVSPALSGR